VGRLRELAKYSVSSDDRLHDMPRQLTTRNIYFTFVASFDTAAEALSELAHFRKNFPFLSFDLYPPYPTRKDWRIAFASYVDKAHADRVGDLARVLGIAKEIGRHPSQETGKQGLLSSPTEHADAPYALCLRS
jgi:hypothetical protein